MKIKITSLFVNDQNKALEFYTKNLGFVKKTDTSAGKYRWLTVVSTEDPNGPQLALEPNENPAARSYQESIFKQGIPTTMFFVDDIEKEYQRLKKLGVKFTMEPTKGTRLNHSKVRRHRWQPDTDNTLNLAKKSVPLLTQT